MKVGSFRSAEHNSETGGVIILVLHQYVIIEDQEPTLLCPNQLQENGIIVNDVSRSLPGGDIGSPHSIYVP